MDQLQSTLFKVFYYLAKYYSHYCVSDKKEMIHEYCQMYLKYMKFI